MQSGKKGNQWPVGKGSKPPQLPQKFNLYKSPEKHKNNFTQSKKGNENTVTIWDKKTKTFRTFPKKGITINSRRWKKLPRLDKNLSYLGIKPVTKRKKWRRKDKYASQKALAKHWAKVDRTSYATVFDYINTNKQLKKIYKSFLLKTFSTKTRTIKQSSGQFNNYLIEQNLNNELLNQISANFVLYHSVIGGPKNQKRSISIYDKVFYYYTLQTPLAMNAHKAFSYFEMQLNATLTRAKLVPYLFMVHALCFYRLVYVNQVVAINQHQSLTIYDSVSLPVFLHNYFYYRQYRIQYSPHDINLFLKNYWSHFTNYTNNKVWILSNFIKSDVTAEAIIFDYPNIMLYMGPFKRFTKIYYRNHPYAPTGSFSSLNYTHTTLKLKLFEYAAFYR